MKWLMASKWRPWQLGLAVLLLVGSVIHLYADDPEIAVMLGEPWEDMRQRSSADIDPAIPGTFWGRLTRTDARLRFIDPQYGFVTPLARFFTVAFNHERVDNVTMSPQIEPLLIDDTLKVVLDLQEQWRKGGWITLHTESNPPLADTPEWRTKLRDTRNGVTVYWQAGDKYQILLDVGRFRDYRNPKEERYLITFQLAVPWIRP